MPSSNAVTPAALRERSPARHRRGEWASRAPPARDRTAGTRPGVGTGRTWRATARPPGVGPAGRKKCALCGL